MAHTFITFYRDKVTLKIVLLPTMSTIKSISERISFKDHDDYTTVVISTKIDRWKESLMLFWVLAWSFCGAYFVYELSANEHDKETTLALVIMIAFWVYFEFKIGKAFLWRKFGVEFIKIEDNQLFYKRSIKGYGKSKTYFCNNIKHLEKIEKSKLSPLGFLEQSAWFVGGETVQFSHQNKIIRFGMQLSDKETNKLLDILKRKIKKNS